MAGFPLGQQPSESGKARIAAAQRAPWQRWRQERLPWRADRTAAPLLGLGPHCEAGRRPSRRDPDQAAGHRL